VYHQLTIILVPLKYYQLVAALLEAVAILELKKWGGYCGAKEKAGGQHKCLSCKVIFHD